METWNISKKQKIQKLKLIKSIDDNNQRILYILHNLGPQRFTDLIKYSSLSRSTVNKYLNSNYRSGNIDKKLFKDKKTNKQFQGYHITEKGIEVLIGKGLKHTNANLIVNELSEVFLKLSELVLFYKEIGLFDSFIIHIVRIISKIGENFFQIEQNRDLYMALFYVFYNSILGQGAFATSHWCLEPIKNENELLDKSIQSQNEEVVFSGYKLNLDQFCDVFNVSREAIDYYARHKLIENNLGFFLIKREQDDFFFHEEDLLGTTTLRLIKDRLIEEVIHFNIVGLKEFYDLDKMSEDIIDKLKRMGLVWSGIQEHFNLLVVNLIIKTALDMGLLKTSYKLMKDLVSKTKLLPKTKEGKQLQDKIKEVLKDKDDSREFKQRDFDIKGQYNILTVIEPPNEDILGNLKGFCPECGNLISKINKEECPNCFKIVNTDNLIKDIEEAKLISKKFKSAKNNEDTK